VTEKNRKELGWERIRRNAIASMRKFSCMFAACNTAQIEMPEKPEYILLPLLPHSVFLYLFLFNRNI